MSKNSAFLMYWWDFRVVIPSVAAGPLDDDPVEELLAGLHLAQNPGLRLLATAHVELDDALADQVFGRDEVLLVPRLVEALYYILYLLDVRAFVAKGQGRVQQTQSQ